MWFAGKMRPPLFFLDGGGFKLDIILCGGGFFFLFLVVNFKQNEC